MFLNRRSLGICISPAVSRRPAGRFHLRSATQPRGADLSLITSPGRRRRGGAGGGGPCSGPATTAVQAVCQPPPTPQSNVSNRSAKAGAGDPMQWQADLFIGGPTLNRNIHYGIGESQLCPRTADIQSHKPVSAEGAKNKNPPINWR